MLQKVDVTFCNNCNNCLYADGPEVVLQTHVPISTFNAALLRGKVKMLPFSLFLNGEPHIMGFCLIGRAAWKEI